MDKFSTMINGAKCHDVTHNSGVLDKKIQGFVVPEGGVDVDILRLNDGTTNVRGDFGCDVPLKAGMIIKAPNGSWFNYLEISSNQVGYVPFLSSDA